MNLHLSQPSPLDPNTDRYLAHLDTGQSTSGKAGINVIKDGTVTGVFKKTIEFFDKDLMRTIRLDKKSARDFVIRNSAPILGKLSNEDISNRIQYLKNNPPPSAALSTARTMPVQRTQATSIPQAKKAFFKNAVDFYNLFNKKYKADPVSNSNIKGQLNDLNNNLNKLNDIDPSKASPEEMKEMDALCTRIHVSCAAILVKKKMGEMLDFERGLFTYKLKFGFRFERKYINSQEATLFKGIIDADTALRKLL